MRRIVIIDYRMGNIESILNAFRRLGIHCEVSSDPKLIAKSDAIILPGVGAFHSAVHNLHALGFYDVLNEQILHYQKPFLGICLGMQLIAEDSNEAELSQGFGWIKGHVVKIDTENHYPVPHVGWNNVAYANESILFKGINEDCHFFFDHSYHLTCDPSHIIAEFEYGGRRVAAVQKDNIFGVQFHPEKSQKNGLKCLRNFLNYS